MVAQRFIAFCFSQPGGLGYVSDDVSSAKGLKRPATLVGTAETELGNALVQLGVLTQRSLTKTRLRQNGERLCVLASDLELESSPELGDAACRARPTIRNEPELRDGPRKARMGSLHQRGCRDRLLRAWSCG